MANIKGKFDDKFALVAETLSQSLDCGDDIGASAAVFIDGKPIVDIWGGYIDEGRTRLWERDTIVNNFSTTKTMTVPSRFKCAPPLRWASFYAERRDGQVGQVRPVGQAGKTACLTSPRYLHSGA